MLLEEVALHLLRRSGYITVDAVNGDPTLRNVGAGLAVLGRGSEHQIDAIADFQIYQPFSHPQRLLVEAKCYFNSKIGVTVVRNAVGVLKDVNEFWVPSAGPVVGWARYHYQYAVFSASNFSTPAQRYAFAQDVHLFPLSGSRFFQPILDAIRQAAISGRFSGLGSKAISPGGLGRLRRAVRNALRGDDHPAALNHDEAELRESVDIARVASACHELNFAFIGIMGGQLPVFLVPNPEIRIPRLANWLHIHIFWNEEGWFIKDTNGRSLFSFDLPKEIFALYSTNGFLSQERALDMKAEVMANIQIFEVVDGHVRVIHLVLDRDWLNSIRRGLDLRQGD